MPKTRVFLSLATNEFGSIRKELTDCLSRGSCDVEVQERFGQSPSDTLEMLAGHISSRKLGSVDLMVHVMGDHVGSVADGRASEAFLDSISDDQDFLERYPVLREELRECRDITYTMWEAYLALHYNVDLLVYHLTGGEADSPESESARRHLQRLKGGANRYATRVSSEQKLIGTIAGDVIAWVQNQENESVRIREQLDELGSVSGYEAEPPSLPESYLPRKRIVQQIPFAPGGGDPPAANHGASTHRFRSCVLCGASGFGKSAIASEFYRNWQGEKTWINANEPFTIPSPSDPDAYLVVVDKLDDTSVGQDETDGHGVESKLRASAGVEWLDGEKEWIRSCAGNMLFVTSQEEVVEMICRLRGCADGAQIYVDGFSDEECLAFLRSTIIQGKLELIKEETLQLINGKIGGCPSVWQLLADLIRSDRKQALDKLLEGEELGDLELITQAVFEDWIEVLDVKGPCIFKALQAICCVSMIGIDDPALDYLLDEFSVEEIREDLKRLTAKGLLQRRHDGSYVPHSFLRTACYGVSTLPRAEGSPCDRWEDVSELREHLVARYERYLDEQLKDTSQDKPNSLALLDAWLVDLRETFSDTEGNVRSFSRRYADAFEKLSPTLGKSDLRRRSIVWLANYLKSEVTRLYCSSLIPLCQVIQEIQPRSNALSEILWKATLPSAHHADTWALAEIISAASTHWSEQGDDERQTGIARLLDFFETWQACFESGQPYFERRRDDDEEELISDLSNMQVSTSVLSGLCLLGGAPTVLPFVSDYGFVEANGSAMVAATLFFAERDKNSAARELIRAYWEPTPFTQEKLVAHYYLRERGYEMFELSDPELTFNPQYIGIMSRWMHTPGLHAYATTLSKRGRSDRDGFVTLQM